MLKGMDIRLEALGTRLDIEVFQVGNEYTVVVTNFYMAVKTVNPGNIAYKLGERGMLGGDCKNVEWAVAKATGFLEKWHEPNDVTKYEVTEL